MSPTDHKWTRHAQVRLLEAHSAAAAVVISVEAGAHLWQYDLPLIDQAIANLQEAKALHLARMAQDEKAA